MIKKKVLLHSLVLLCFGNIIGGALQGDGKTTILYDAVSRKVPEPSLLGFTALPLDAVSMLYEDGATTMDTTLSDMDTYAGWVSNPGLATGFPVLDRAASVQVHFTLQLESESHTSHDRAGFSLIILDKDAKGIELSFWENEIWAQNDDVTGGLFTHGEGVTFGATSDLTDYQLSLEEDGYTLMANSVPILTGEIRDYSNFEGFIDPYETPNFLFLGDDTTSAQARVRLSYVSVTGTKPILPTQIVTLTSTSLPQPTATPVLLPSVTPVSTSTPESTGIDICPSGWLLATVIFSSLITRRTIRRKPTDHG